MNLLIAGVLLWVLGHLSPSFAPGLRQSLIDKVGAGPYRGVFALMIVSSLLLIVFGWRGTPEEYLYILPVWSRQLGFVLMFASVFLLGAAHGKSIIKRYIRHPMLMGVFVWSVSHLLTNGTTRALILFGALGIWALIEMPLINARNRDWARPEATPLTAELKGLIISAVVFSVLILIHPYIAGVSPLPL
jgi:uncharacterized membrane protein